MTEISPEAAQTQPQTSAGHPGHRMPVVFGSTPETTPASPKSSGAGRTAAVILAAALVGGAAGLGGGYLGAGLGTGTQVGVVAGPGTVTVNNPGSVNETTAIAAKVLPSVVTIEVSAATTGGSGSGVVISEDGYVITNTHVVSLDGATSNPTLRVTTSDGRLYNATIVGTDPIYDLAVIKLEGASGLTPIEFADSSALNVGSTAVAVGAPLGLSNSVTTGIVSALNRSISISSSALPDSGAQDESEEEDGETFEFRLPGQENQSRTASERISIAVIQTDAAINPGNSGGALVDSQGRLIGINVAIATAGGVTTEAGSIGLGFAIPSNIAHRVASEIIETGAATHGLLGAMVKPASAVAGTTVAGAYIQEVTPGGPAEGAGLRAGDTVTKFNGVPISNANDLTAQVRAVAAGSEATITYVRGDRSFEVTVTLGALAL